MLSFRAAFVTALSALTYIIETAIFTYIVAVTVQQFTKPSSDRAPAAIPNIQNHLDACDACDCPDQP